MKLALRGWLNVYWKGLIVDREPFVFEPESLSANGQDSINIQCAGIPLCAKIEQQSAHSPLVNHGKDSNTISQSIKNSPKLTTLEKQPDNSTDATTIEKDTKLKSQWLNQIQ